MCCIFVIFCGVMLIVYSRLVMLVVVKCLVLVSVEMVVGFCGVGSRMCVVLMFLIVLRCG